jgi:hypothetical protein
MSPAIDQDPARIGVDRAEQSPERIEKADDENRRTESLEIFWDEPDPELFPRANHERRNKKDDKVAFEPEELPGTSPKVHDSVSILPKSLRQSIWRMVNRDKG